MCSYKENQVQSFCQFPYMGILIVYNFSPNFLMNNTLNIFTEVSINNLTSCLRNYGQIIWPIHWPSVFKKKRSWKKILICLKTCLILRNPLKIWQINMVIEN